MASLDAKKTRQSLLKKGFVQSDGDHHFYLFYHDGKVVVKTKLSHNDQDIGDGLITKMYKQCQISKNQFLDLINCPLSKDDYLKLLKQKGVL